MKATELLKKQHDEVKAIFSQLEKGNGRSTALYEKLADKLAAHMAIESRALLPQRFEWRFSNQGDWVCANGGPWRLRRDFGQRTWARFPRVVTVQGFGDCL